MTYSFSIAPADGAFEFGLGNAQTVLRRVDQSRATGAAIIEIKCLETGATVTETELRASTRWLSRRRT